MSMACSRACLPPAFVPGGSAEPARSPRLACDGAVHARQRVAHGALHGAAVALEVADAASMTMPVRSCTRVGFSPSACATTITPGAIWT
jgi:hypothetical protein